MRQSSHLFALLIILTLCLLVGSALAVGTIAADDDPPGPPSSYYGEVTDDDGNPAPVETEIVAVANGSVQDTIEAESSGEYGGDEPFDERLEVDPEYDVVEFYVDGQDGIAFDQSHEPESGTHELDLTTSEVDWSDGEADPGRLVVSALTPDETTVVRGDPLDITATIENTGDIAIEQTVELSFDSEAYDTETVSLDPGAETNVSFESIGTDDLEGSYTFTVATSNDTGEGSVTVELPPPDFQVSDLDPDQVTVSQDDLLDISANVTNEGEQEGTKDVELRLDDDVQATTSVTLEPEESETVVFEEFDTADLAGEYTHSVWTEDDEASGSLTVEVEPANFTVSDLEPESVSVDRGETVNVSATIENTGQENGIKDVELRLDGQMQASESVTLDAGSETTVDLSLPTDDLGGNYTHSIWTEDDEAEGSLTVDFEPAFFDVSGLEPVEVTVQQGETVDVSATVTNTGEETASKVVELRLDGEEQDTGSVSLDPDEAEIVETTLSTDSLNGTYTHSLWTEDSEQTGNLTVEVEADEDDEEGDTDGDEEEGDSDDESEDGDGEQDSDEENGTDEDEESERLADVTIANATVNTTTIAPGEAVLVSATLVNEGTESTPFVAALEVDERVVETRTIDEIPAGDSQPVEFDRRFEEPGTVTVAINGTVADTVTVEAEEEQIESDEEPITIQNATVNATNITTGEGIEVTADVVNQDSEERTFVAALEIDGDVVETQTIESIPADGGTEPVEFTRFLNETGTVTVSINGTQAGLVTVAEADEDDGGGVLGLLRSLLWAVALYLGVPLLIIYLILKALAIYLGY